MIQWNGIALTNTLTSCYVATHRASVGSVGGWTGGLGRHPCGSASSWSAQTWNQHSLYLHGSVNRQNQSHTKTWAGTTIGVTRKWESKRWCFDCKNTIASQQLSQNISTAPWWLAAVCNKPLLLNDIRKKMFQIKTKKYTSNKFFPIMVSVNLGPSYHAYG